MCGPEFLKWELVLYEPEGCHIYVLISAEAESDGCWLLCFRKDACVSSPFKTAIWNHQVGKIRSPLQEIGVYFLECQRPKL